MNGGTLETKNDITLPTADYKFINRSDHGTL